MVHVERLTHVSFYAGSDDIKVLELEVIVNNHDRLVAVLRVPLLSDAIDQHLILVFQHTNHDNYKVTHF